jgi:hypothetical protein
MMNLKTLPPNGLTGRSENLVEKHDPGSEAGKHRGQHRVCLLIENRRLRRRPAKREAALATLIHLYPDGLPDNKVTVVIWNSVNRRLRELGKRPVS